MELSRFKTNYSLHKSDRPKLIGEDQTVPNQSPSITEIIYRFQGGIIPNVVNVQFDPVDAPDDYIAAVNRSGFDITDAFHALNQGKQTYQSYMAEKNANARKEIEAQKAEFERLQNLEKELKEKEKVNQQVNPK